MEKRSRRIRELNSQGKKGKGREESEGQTNCVVVTEGPRLFRTIWNEGGEAIAYSSSSKKPQMDRLFDIGLREFRAPKGSWYSIRFADPGADFTVAQRAYGTPPSHMRACVTTNRFELPQPLEEELPFSL